MNQRIYQIKDALQLELAYQPPRYGLRPEALFALGLRQNQRRSFLFVSRVLGKHLATSPAALLATAKLLACAYTGQADTNDYADIVNGQQQPRFDQLYQRLARCRYHLPAEQRTLFIGFAETATGLAQGVAHCFQGEMAYLHTSRRELPEQTPLTFSEEHSHARQHVLYLEKIAPFLTDCRQAALIDDELTTGQTARNLIRQLARRYPLRRFLVFAILDWSEEEPWQQLAAELDVEIEVISLLRGKIDWVEAQPVTATAAAWDDRRGTAGAAYHHLNLAHQQPALTAPLRAARLPLTATELAGQEEACRQVAALLPPDDGHTLYLGSGEYIYVPALITGWLGGQCFHSTTQSPIYPVADSAIQTGIRFESPDGYSPCGYLYNVPSGHYRRALLFTEAATMRPPGLRQLTAGLQKRGINEVQVVSL